MLFLNPLLLWGLLAASLPVVIHLLNKRRHKPIQWAAMQFLLKATRESRGKKKLRHMLILACRVLAIAALALAAARPIVSALAGWGGGSIDTVVLLLDRSSSMEIKPADGVQSRRKIIIEKARDAMTNLGVSRLVLIDSASNQAQEVPSPDTLAELSSTAATDTTADFPSLINRAAEVLADSSGHSEIWLASDLQSSNWHPNDPRWAAARTSLDALPQKPTLRVLSLTGPTAPNSAIHLLDSQRSGDELLLDLEIVRAADSRGTLSLPLTTQLNGASMMESITIPGQSIRLQKRVTLPAGNLTGSGWVSIPADGNSRDNSAYFAYGPALPVKSIIVAPTGEAADFLTLAAAPPGYENQSTQLIDPTNAETLDIANAAAILWAAPLPSGHTTEIIHRFISSGGQVIFFPPGESSNASFDNLSWSHPTVADAGKFFTLKDWNHRDGPLRDGFNGTPIPAERLKAIRRQFPLGDCTALARWEDGEPFIARRMTERGTAWFVGSLPDYTWSNLGDADVLLPSVQRIIAIGANRFSASSLATIGTESANPKPGESCIRLGENPNSETTNSREQAGIFRFGDRLIAINRPPQEDTPEILTKDQLDQVLDGTHYTLFDQAGKSDDPSLSRDVWRALLIFMLFSLIAEAMLCLPKRNPKAQLEISSKTSNLPRSI
ncbi:MAG: BatA domain-containing protein [Akkermansiaceae bacterium]|nr:BatA domain-containing protein [Akkermansiaceae bacterium]